MNKSPWFKFETTPFLDGVLTLTAAERGVYITLLALMYDQNGPITNDAKWLSKRTGLSAATVRRVVDRLVSIGKFQIDEAGQISNKTAIDVIQKRDISRQSKADAGRISQEKQRERRNTRSTGASTSKKKKKDSPHTPRNGGLIEELNEKGVCLQARVQPASATHQPEGEDHSWWNSVRAELKAAHPDKARMISPIRLAKGRRLVVSSSFDLRPVLEAFGPALQAARAFSVLAEEGDEVVFTQIGQRGAA